MDEEENNSQMSSDSMEQNLDTMKNGAETVGNAVGDIAGDAADKLKEKGKKYLGNKLKSTKMGKQVEKAKAKAQAVAKETEKGTKKVVKGATTMGTGAALAGAGAATHAAGAALSAAGKSITAGTAGFGAAIGEAMDIAGQGMQHAGKSMVEGGKKLINHGQKTIQKGTKQIAKAPMAEPSKSSSDDGNIGKPEMPKIDFGGKKSSNLKKKLKALIGNNPKVKLAIIAALVVLILIIIFVVMVASTVKRGKHVEGDYSNVPFVVTEFGLDKLEIYSDGNGGYTYGFADEEGNPRTLDETLDTILETLKKNDSHELAEMGKDDDERKEFLKLLIQAEVSTQFPDITISDSIDAKDITGGNNGGTGTTPAVLGKDFIVKTDEPDAAPVLNEQQLKDAVNKSNLSDEAKQNLLSVIPDIVNYQEQYKVNAVFLMAVARKESTCGTNWDYIDPSTYNWLSVKGTLNGGYVDRKGTSWNRYSSFSDASEAFFKLISGSENYFKGGKISVKQIAPTYCDAAWGEAVIKYMNEFFQYAGAKTDSEVAAIDDASLEASPAKSQSNIAQWGWVIQNENINAYYYEHGYGTITYSSPYVKGYITEDGKDYIVTSNSTGWYIGQGVQLRTNSSWNNYNIGLLNSHGVDTSSLQVGSTISADVVDLVSQEIFAHMKNEVESQAKAKGLSLTENQIVALTDIAYLNGNVRTQLDNIAKYGADSEQLANTSGFAPCGENDTATSRAQNAWKLFHYGKYEAKSGSPYDPQYFGGTPSSPGGGSGGTGGGGATGGDGSGNGGQAGETSGQSTGGAQAGGVDANGVTITSGGNIDFLNYAIDSHALLREDGFTYDSGGREMPVVRGDKVHTIDCVAYISMALDYYGKKDWQYYPHQLTSSSIVTYGQSSLETVYSGRASTINEISDLQSGDILVMPGHAQIFYGYASTGQPVWLNCGDNKYISAPEGQDIGWYATPITYVFRVPGGSGSPYTGSAVPALSNPTPGGSGGGGSSNLSAPDLKVLENNDDSVNGNITLKRKDESGNVKELKFIDEATFYRLLNANDERVMDYYTLKKGVGVNGNDEDFGGSGSGGGTGGGAGVPGGATLSGSELKEQIWNFLIDSGCTEEGAAGLMGNLEAESGCKPVRVQGDYNHGNADEYSANYTARVDSGEISEHDFVYNGPGGGGYGLAQWTSSNRKQGLYDHVKSKGTSIGDLQSQLEYLIQELSTSYSSVWSVLTSTHDINEASDIVLTKFEIPADISGNRPVRRNNAQQIYDTYAGTRSPGGSGEDASSPTSPSNPAEASTTGVEGALRSAKVEDTPSRKTVENGGADQSNGDGATPAGGETAGGDGTTPADGETTGEDTTTPADGETTGGDTTSPASGDMTTSTPSTNSSSTYSIVVASYQKKTITSVDAYTYSHTDVISTNSGTTGAGSQFSSTPAPYTTTKTTEKYKATYIDYQTALKNHTLYFDFMWALFETTGDKKFIEDFAQEALDSKIEITVYPDKKVTTNVTQSGIQPKQVYSQDGSTVYVDYYDGSNTTTTTTTTIISRGCITLANVWTMEYENDADTYSEFKSKSKEVIREKIEDDDKIMKLLRTGNRNRRLYTEYYLLERMIQDNGKVSHLLEVFKYYLQISLGTPKDKIELSEEIIDTNLFDLNKGNWASTVTVLAYTSINATEEEKEMLYAAVESMTSQFADDAENTQRKKYITSVILNRVLSSKFPNTITEVLQQSGQFPNYDPSAAGGTYSDSTKSAVDAILQSGDCSKRSIYFNTPSGASSLGWDTKYTKTLNDGDGSDNSYSYYTDKEVAAELGKFEVGVGAGETTPSDRAQQIIAWAEAQVGKSSFYSSYAGKNISSDGYCAAFVKSAYYEAGFEYIGGNAGDLPHPNQIKFNDDGTVDYSEIPAGAIIVSHGTPYKGVLYGHVCLYVGNGYVIEAGGKTVKKSPIDDSFGGKGHNCAPFIGWGFATNDQDAAYQELVVQSAPGGGDGGDFGGDGGSGIDGASYPQGWTPMDCGPWADGGAASSGSGILGVFHAGDKAYTAYCMGAGPWANTRIAEPSIWISDAGCGITSLSTIFTGFGINVTPNSFAGQHSAGDNYVEQHIKEYGLNYKKLNGITDVVSELENGNPVIYHVRGGNVGGKYYGSGHYVALLGINSSGEIFVADPGSTHNCGYFPQSKFTGFVSAYSVYR